MRPPDSQNFPAELSYLLPALQELAKIPDEDLNEDVDASELESALRERVKGLALREAVSRLTEDSRILVDWIKETKTKDAAAMWISAFLMRPGPLARGLLAPPVPPGPVIEMKIPLGWSCKRVPKQFVITLDKIFCVITLLDHSNYELLIRQNEVRERAQNDPSHPTPDPGKWLKLPVQFGESRGYKYSQSPPRWKSLEYILEVNGGFVYVHIGHQKGKDFDEGEIEAKLHTIKILPPGRK